MRSAPATALVTVLLLGGATPLRAASTADVQAARTLSSLAAIELARDKRFDVLSTADLREVVALEGEKQALGCDVDSSSCLAEVAGAMGARFVVFGQLGKLGTAPVLTLSLYDSDEGRTPGRVLVRGADSGEIADGIGQGMIDLVAAVNVPEGETLRVLVLDIRPPDDLAPGEGDDEVLAGPPADENLPLMLIGGGGLAALGAVGIAAGGVSMVAAVLFHSQASDTKVQTERAATYDQRDIAGGLGVGVAALGGLTIAAGVGMAVYHLVAGAE